MWRLLSLAFTAFYLNEVLSIRAQEYAGADDVEFEAEFFTSMKS